MKNIKLQKILRLSILFLFAIVFIMTIIMGTVYNYVHKRHIPMIIFAIIIFILSGILETLSIRKKLEQKFEWSILIFFIPIVFYFFSTEKLSLSSVAQNIDLNVQSEQNSVESFNFQNTQSLELVDDKIIMDDESFGMWLSEIYINTETYSGKKIEITGELWYDENLGENEFAIVRLMMTCCAADMQAVGFLCEVKNKLNIKSGEWVKIDGVLKEREYENKMLEPYIEVINISKAKRPLNEYVYPF